VLYATDPFKKIVNPAFASIGKLRQQFVWEKSSETKQTGYIDRKYQSFFGDKT